MNTDFKRYVIDEISRMPFYHVSPDGTSHTIKCPYCNDDSPRHGHFGLKIDLESKDPILYHCFKCSAGGIVNQKVLSDLGITLPQELASQMYKSNKIYSISNKITEVRVMPFEIPLVSQYTDPAVIKLKTDYIRDRIGLDITCAEAPAYRIILSFRDFIVFNKIHESISLDTHYIEYIDNNYVGFLSVNKNCIIFRRVTTKCSKQGKSLRYIKFMIDDKNLDPNNFYTIPTKFDIMSTDPINIHISEGPFDILSIMTHNIFRPIDNNVFFAVCGFGYAGVIKNIIRMGACPINLYVYADNDKTDSAIKRQLLNKKVGLVNYIDNMSIIRNSFPNEKDFGVPNNRIKPSYKKIIIPR